RDERLAENPQFGQSSLHPGRGGKSHRAHEPLAPLNQRSIFVVDGGEALAHIALRGKEAQEPREFLVERDSWRRRDLHGLPSLHHDALLRQLASRDEVGDSALRERDAFTLRDSAPYRGSCAHFDLPSFHLILVRYE